MAALTESNYLSDWLTFELDNKQSREQGTFAIAESVVMAEVCGKVTKSTPTTGTANAGNTGEGTCTAVTAGDETLIGIYTLECTAVADASAGLGAAFSVMSPDGDALPDAEADVAFTNEQLNFTINTVGVAFIVGDSFTVTVAAGSGQIMALSLTAVDGTQDAYGISIGAYGAAAATDEGVLVVRDAQIVPAYLTWPAGASDAQKAAALAQLKLNGIVERNEA